jgi:Zn-dependent peptidase ImmA (M78 family)/transcriptional regulator with XRE-family HTH domain
VSSRRFQPARLRLARKLRGITQKDLARELDLTPAAVSQYESGAHAPSTEVVERLVVALRCLPDFFFRPLSVDDELPAFFRSLRAAAKHEQDRARSFALLLGEAAELLDHDVELPSVEIPRVPVEADTPDEEIERAAAQVRAAWRVDSGPIAHVLRLVEAHGALVVAVGDFDSRLDAFSLWVCGRPVVVLCSDKGVPKRRRFDAAHELGHLVLHTRIRPGDRVAERQAHRFASALLMPADEIRPWLPRRSNQVEVVRRASEVWGVSMQAVLYRARTLGTLSDAGFTRAMRRMSALGWRTDEPVEAGPEEVPSVLGVAIEALRDAGGSTRRLAAQLGVPHGRLCRMFAVPEERDREPGGELLKLPAVG